MEKQSQHEKAEALEATIDAFNRALQETLSNTGCVGNTTQINSVVGDINQSVRESMCSHYAFADQAQKIVQPLDYKIIRTSYIEGPYSIMKNLPMPEVSLLHGCAHIPASQIVNHFLALKKDVEYYRAGIPEDWLRKDGKYACVFIAEVHASVKKLLRDNPCLPKDTRVVLGRIWSDGFQAHHIVAKNGFSSLQLFTLSILAPKGKISKHHTWPCALCFKKANTPDIFLHILKEVNDMKEPAARYWGKEKKSISTIVYLDMLSQDYPERCYCTCTADIGKFTHRWRYTCMYVDDHTPSCADCEWNRINHILDQNDEEIKGCSKCQDWWGKGRNNVFGREKKYPIGPSEAIKMSGPSKTIETKMLDIPSVEISFEMLENSIVILQEWTRECIKKKTITKRSIPGIVKEYLKLLGLQPPISEGLGKDIVEGMDAKESRAYPLILKRYKEVGVEMKKFSTMPMHLLFLGLEKSLMSKTPIIVNRMVKVQNEFWKGLTRSMQLTQRAVNSISVSWCRSMAFSGMENNIGTAGWQSSHCVAFTRL